MKGNNSFINSKIIAKDAVQKLLSSTFRSILIRNEQQSIPNKTLQEMEKALNLNFELMYFQKNKVNKLGQINETKSQAPDNYGSGVYLIKKNQNNNNEIKAFSSKADYLSNIQNKKTKSKLVKQVENINQNQSQSNTSLDKTPKKTNREKKISKSQKFIRLLSQTQIAQQKEYISNDDSLRTLLEEKKQKILQIQKSKNQNKFKIMKRQKQIKQKFKNLHQFSYNYDGTPLTIKQSNKDFMANREDFIEMRTNVLRKIIKRKKNQFVNQLNENEQVNYQNKSKKISELTQKNKKAYHKQISLSNNSPNSILELFSSKHLLQKGTKIKQEIKGNQKQLFNEKISDLQSKPIEKMNKKEFKQLLQKRDFIPTSKLLLQTNKKRSKTSMSSQHTLKPQIKITNLQSEIVSKFNNRYSQYQCITEPSQSNIKYKISAKKTYKKKIPFSQSEDKSCKISVTDRKSFESFLNLSRCS